MTSDPVSREQQNPGAEAHLDPDPNHDPNLDPNPDPTLASSGSSQGYARVVTALAVSLPMFLLLWLGGPFVAFLLLVPPLIIALEWAGMAGTLARDIDKLQPGHALAATLLIFVALVVFLAVTGHFRESLATLVFGIAGLSIVARAMSIRRLTSTQRGTRFWIWPLGLLYISVPYVCAAMIIAIDSNGIYLLMALMSLVWCGDIGAYYVGTRFGQGRIPIIGRISPKKSVQGFAGGVVTGTLGFLFFLLQTPLPLWLVVFAPFLSLVAHVGDLLESGMKRFFNRKDSGQLLPGHGGLMDRMDGFALLMPLTIAALWAGALPWIQTGEALL